MNLLRTSALSAALCAMGAGAQSLSPAVAAVNTCTSVAGNGTAYACTLPGIAVRGYAPGATYTLQADVANTGPATVAFGKLKPVPILKNSGAGLAPLAAGDIDAGQYVTMVWDGSQMQAAVAAVGGGGGTVDTTARSAASSAQSSAAAAQALAQTSVQKSGDQSMNGGLQTGGMVRGPKLGAVRQADDPFYGSGDPAGRINAAIIAAAAGGGDTVDARGFSGAQNMGQQITVLSGVTMILPTHGVWKWALTDGVSAGILQKNGSTVMGYSAGGGGSQMILDSANSSTNMLALWTTDAGPNNTAPSGGGSYVYTSGFLSQNTGGGTFAHGLNYPRYLFDESIITRVMAHNATGDSWHIYSVCCDMEFQQVQAYSEYGSAGGTPVVVEAGHQGGSDGRSFQWHGTANGAGTGHPNIQIGDYNYQTDWFTDYTETDAAGNASLTDSATAAVANSLLSSPPVFIGGHMNRSGSKPCFSNPQQPGLVSINWCPDGNVYGNANLSFPYPHGLMTTGAGGFQDSGITVYNRAFDSNGNLTNAGQHTGFWSVLLAGKLGSEGADGIGPNVRAGVGPSGDTARVLFQDNQGNVTEVDGRNKGLSIYGTMGHVGAINTTTVQFDALGNGNGTDGQHVCLHADGTLYPCA